MDDEDDGEPISARLMGIDTIMSTFANAKTLVYWDTVDFPVTDIVSFDENIRSALQKAGYLGDVLITAYGDKIADQEVRRYRDTNITYVSGASRRSRIHQMLVDMYLFELENYTIAPPTNLMVITRTIIPEQEEKGMDFHRFLVLLNEKCYNILLAVPDDCQLETVLVDPLKSVWRWNDLLGGGDPIPKRVIDESLSRARTDEETQRTDMVQ